MSENITTIPAPRVDFIDPRTGLMAREWYRFFLNMFMLTGAGSSTITITDLAVAPSIQEDISALANVGDQAQLAAMQARYDDTLSAIQGAYLQPPVSQDVLALDPTAFAAPRQEIGTLASQNADRVNITGGSISGVTFGSITSGTYTPTLTNVANLDASTAYQCQYLRSGATVVVSGRVDVDPTLTTTATQLGISLPVASNFGATEDCAGTAFASAIAGQGAAILGDTTNDRAQMEWISADVTNQPMYFCFAYQVI